ncbi:hypothetical protein TSUD_82560 [Trifolium subterraneum]|uniref:Uncharacterized protein n=1 Tax=Trifolium subterraneum TaxID=3900 RepID=A0A2Z6LHJ3_TRISU|nr:hypothetical protein TSUD_82560 [Trifolium subterraneum]
MAHSNSSFSSCSTDVCLNGLSCTSCTTQMANNKNCGQQKKTDLGLHSYSYPVPTIEVNARRRCYVNPVLKPVENLEQWNLLKETEAKRDDIILAARDVKKSNARDKRYNNNPVLKPVENFVQFKLVTFEVKQL